MKYYISYMDRQTASPQLHDKLLAMRETAHPSQAKKGILPRWKQWAALAACCALLVGIGIWKQAPVQSGGQFATEPDSLVPGAKDAYGPGELPPEENSFVVSSDRPQAEGEKIMFPAIPYINYSDVTFAPDIAADIALPEGSFQVDLTQEQIQAIFWGPEGETEADHPKLEQGTLPWMLFWDGYTVHGRAIYDGEGNLFVLDIFGEYPDQNASFELSLSPGRLPPTCVRNPGRESTDVFGVSVTAWRQSYDRNGDGLTDYVCGSEFMAGDAGVRFESVGAPFQVSSDGDPMAAACQFNALFVRRALTEDGGLYLDHLLRSENIPQWRVEKFSSLAQAREEEEFAPYLPVENIPGHGEFYGRLSYQEDRENMLFVRWSRGYDDVEVCVYRDGYVSYNLVDVSNPASYDRRLYEIPLADTVPAEYRDTIWTPAFRAEDMSVEVVKARGTEKDTGGMSYRFQVLYPDGTLVEYNCGGLMAEQVWELAETALSAAGGA